MKTYLPQIERRIIVRPNQSYGILNYDRDNAYPQRVWEFVRQAPTAKRCWQKLTKFLHGSGFEDQKLNDFVVNEFKKLTLGRLLRHVAADKAMFKGFGIHINYDANYRISSVNYIQYEDIRQGDTDSEKYRGKYLVYPDWGHKTWKAIFKSKIQCFTPFNPDPKVIREEVIAAGGWENYTGQLYYFNPVIDDYPLARADDAMEDFETEAGIKTYRNRSVTVGFMPDTVITMKSRREEADNVNSDQFDGINPVGGPSQLERDLGTFQGVHNGKKILVLEYDDENAKPEITNFPIQNTDKLFEATEKSVEASIIKAWGVPKQLVSSSDKTGLGDSGGDKREAIKELNDETAEERTELSEVFKMIFENFAQPLPSNNWQILEIPTEGAGQTNIQNSDKIQTLCFNPAIPKVNKVAILMYTYGYTEKEATRMVPEDNAIKPTEQQTTNQPDNGNETINQ